MQGSPKVSLLAHRYKHSACGPSHHNDNRVDDDITRLQQDKIGMVTLRFSKPKDASLFSGARS